jgi:hypothetical protein
MIDEIEIAREKGSKCFRIYSSKVDRAKIKSTIIKYDKKSFVLVFLNIKTRKHIYVITYFLAFSSSSIK